MNKMPFVSLVAVAALTGCATTAPVAARPTIGVAPSVETSTVPPDSAEVALPPGVIPDARPEPYGPPQNWAWLHRPPLGCERGPLSVEVRNSTDMFLRLVLDGRDLVVRGADGMMPHLPPGESAYLCLSEIGAHTIAGVAYSPRYGELQEVDTFSSRTRFGSRMMGALPRHVFVIDTARLSRN